jgi:hypothetical protein
MKFVHTRIDCTGCGGGTKMTELHQVIVQPPDRAGRAAEQLIYGMVITGAENDIKQVTELARWLRAGA